tara:strand:- start:197 stop:502 length:306 start_codon:yes stop_codon:yes gene_type:complete
MSHKYNPDIDLIKKLSQFYRFSEYDKHELNIIKANYLNENIVNIELDLDHDGYDRDGPQSNLWDLKIYYIKDNINYLDVWHREDWFTDDDDNYELFEKIII